MSAPPKPISNQKAALLNLWPLLLPLLLLLPGLFDFPYPSPAAPFSDLAITHYPNALFLKRALLEWKTIPLWSPTILSGYPFAANPLSGLWYPPGWLALLFPLPLGFNLLVIAHLLWGGVGLYRFLRARSLSHPAALFGALAFEFMPKVFAHYGAGHLTLLYALSWTPWLLLAETTYRSESRRPWYSQPGLILALIFLADPRWAAFAGILWLAWSLAHSHPRFLEHILHALKQLALSALLASPLALPLLEYARLSTRAALIPKDVLAYSLPPSRLLGLLFPDFGGFHEWMLYVGAAVLCLALLTIVWPTVRRRSAFWLWVALLSLLFSLGQYLPGMEFLAGLPGFSLLRVPSRALFLTGLSLAILAAFALDHLLAAPAHAEIRRARLALASLAFFTVAFASVALALTGRLSLNFIWGAGAIFLAFIWLLLGLSNRLSPKVWLPLLFTFYVLDVSVFNLSLFSPRPASQVLAESQELAEFLAAQPGPFRVYSPSYSLPQQTAAVYGLELADGVDPLQLASYVVFMESAIGIPNSGYSITLPPLGDDPSAISTANAAYVPDPSLLALLNIRYVASGFDLSIPGLEFIRQFGEVRLYENRYALPRAWVQPFDLSLGEDVLPAEIVSWTPNRIRLSTRGPGLLVLSEIAYPGWHVSVDSNPAQIQEADGLLRAVELDEGLHQVVFTSRPLSVYLGLALSLLTLAALILVPRIRKPSRA